MSPLPEDETRTRFDYHAPVDGKEAKHTRIRLAAERLNRLIDEEMPDCREKAVAMTHLETAMFWANAGVARGRE